MEFPHRSMSWNVFEWRPLAVALNGLMHCFLNRPLVPLRVRLERCRPPLTPAALQPFLSRVEQR